MTTLRSFLAGLALAAMAVTPSAWAEQSPLWIDVRSPAEYATGHLPGAPNVPFRTIGQRIGALADGRDADIRLYCASGGRSAVAQRILQTMGYTNVRNVGGYAEAQAAFARRQPPTAGAAGQARP